MSFQNSLHQTSSSGKIVLLISLMALCTLLTLFTLFGLNALFFHFPLDVVNHLSSSSSRDSIYAAKIVQITTQIGLFILPTILFSYLTSASISQGLALDRKTNWKGYVVVILSTLLIIPFINLLAEWNTTWHLPKALQGMEEWMRQSQTTNDEIMKVIAPMHSHWDIAVNLFMMAILPAIGEEFVFRGVLQKQLGKIFGNPHLGILVAALIFSAIHLQFLGFFSRAILGVLFGYLFYFSKNIWLPIFAHFINNFLALLLILLFGVEASETAFENVFNAIYLGLSIAGFIVSLILVYSYRNKFRMVNTEG